MTKPIFVCASLVTLVLAVAPTLAGERPPKEAHAVRIASSAPKSTGGDCEDRIEKLDDSNAEGEERLTEKNKVINFCSSQYEHDKTIQKLVDECAKYEQQPVLKQQFVAECQLAAFKYANALRELKSEYKK